ncbi:GntR family transcriptional regulator [Stutzerimonas stutzeri]|uniref:GntR family transcriptional regulator n=1 Tax=Stutzerimonas stutzeri TaxID=316 RepID=UPI00210919DD|nr:GntR family transcriptional regulator [Stutzerimonas stutzeri]MCQ4320168.1 GntR family transcriptional regulator [Stutzerimonas stutzeri]
MNMIHPCRSGMVAFIQEKQPLEKIQHKILYQEAANRIRELIEHGTLVAGEKISEKQLCETFGISRTPLREALKVLTSEGLVEILPNRGARVSRLSLSDVTHTYDVMAALEGLAGETACSRLNDEELVSIGALHQKLVEHYARKELQAYFTVNQQIHEKILLASGNPILLEMYNNLSQRVKRIRYSMEMNQDFWRKAMNDHEEMIEALRERDGNRLGNILRGHLSHKLEAVNLEGAIVAD